MIVFEMPSHIKSNHDYIKRIAKICKYPDRIGFAIALNGNQYKDNCIDGNFVAEYRTIQITEPCISMVEIRGLANEVATKYFNPKYRIMADHNFTFNPGWEDYILEAVNDMERFTAETNKFCYLSMGGTLGAYRHDKRTFISPQGMYPCGRGIIYTDGNVYNRMQKLPSSLEEQYLCSTLFFAGHIPLRKMMSPIYHVMKRGDTGIHDLHLVDIYNGVIVREMWNDPQWMVQPVFSRKDQPPPGRYYAHSPKNARKAMIKIKAEYQHVIEALFNK